MIRNRNEPNLFRGMLPFLLIVGLWAAPHQSFGVPTSGLVLDSSTDLPISGARVRFSTQEGRSNPAFTLTDPEGRFVLEIPSTAFPTITAASFGYINGRDETVIPGATDVLILLRPASTPPAGNPFPFIDPAASSCAGCHMSQYMDWAGFSGVSRPSRHATAGQNRWVRDLYDGSGTPGGAEGYLFVRDSPLHDETINPSGLHTSGLCAECHLPTLSALAPVLGTVKLSDATAGSPLGSPERFAYDNGIVCGVCHKTESVNDQLGRTGFFGNGELLLSDPGLAFGPLDDAVINLESQMLAAYNPLLGESRVCAPCHEYNMDHDFDDDFDEVGSPPGQTTFSEWLVSPQATLGIQCQDCHMIPEGMFESPICVFGGLVRPATANHSHRFEGTSLPFLQAAVAVIAEASQVGTEVHARFEVSNVGAGHNFPTGVSVRNAMLVVRARTESATDLAWLPGSDLIPSWGGVGDDDNDYGNTPGRGFAKVLRGRNETERVLFIDAIGVLENTQIRAGETDVSRYRFDASGLAEGEVIVEGRIVYRRAWKDLAESKGWIGGLDSQGFPYQGDLFVESALARVNVNGASPTPTITETATPPPTEEPTPTVTDTPTAEPSISPSNTPTSLPTLPPTPVPSLDAALLLDLIEGWRAGMGSPVEIFVQQNQWFR